MPGRLPDAVAENPQQALDAFWAERRVLAGAALAGLDFAGAIRPLRATTERDWLRAQAAAGGPPADRESPVSLAEPPGPRRRRR